MVFKPLQNTNVRQSERASPFERDTDLEPRLSRTVLGKGLRRVRLRS